MVWSKERVRLVIWALRYVLELADLDDGQADQVTGIVLPKLVEESGLGVDTFGAIAVAVLRPVEEGCPTRH
jgi:hypothetical protein